MYMPTNLEIFSLLDEMFAENRSIQENLFVRFSF